MNYREEVITVFAIPSCSPSTYPFIEVNGVLK